MSQHPEDERPRAQNDAEPSPEDRPSPEEPRRVRNAVAADRDGEITATAGIPRIKAALLGAGKPKASSAPDPSASPAAPGGDPSREDDASEPQGRGMPRFVAVTLGLASVTLILLFVREIQDIVAPIFLGLNLMIVVYPVQRFLARFIHRYLAATVALLLVFAVLVGFVWSCVWALIELASALPSYNKEFLALWTTVTDFAAQQGVDSAMLTKQISDIKPNDVMSLLLPVVTNVSSIASLLTTLLIATFFLAMDGASFGNRLKLLRVVQPRALAVVTDFSTGVRRYWLVTTIFGLIVAAADVAALAIIGVPLIWVWGVLSFITNYIPNIGFVIGLVPPALLALLDGGPTPAIAVVITYTLLNFVIQVIIQPKFTGESVGVTPTVSFLSLLFWVFILGPLGALLALPATLLVKAFLVDSDPNARWLNIFIASSADTALPDNEQPEPRSPRKARKARERRALLRG